MNVRLAINDDKDVRRFSVRRQPYHPVRSMTIKDKATLKGSGMRGLTPHHSVFDMAAGLPDAIGRYEVLERIGHGGMGTLYRARDPRIGRDVAIKLLREELDDGETRERFAREARSAGQLELEPDDAVRYE